MNIDLASGYLLPVEAWSDPVLLRKILSKGDLGTAEWALLASAARCDDEPIQLAILPFVSTRVLWSIPSGHPPQSYIRVLLESFRDSCDQLGTSWEDPKVTPDFPKLIENALVAGFRPSSADLEFVEKVNLIAVSRLFERFADNP